MSVLSVLSVSYNLWPYLLSWRRLLLRRRAAETCAAPLHTSLPRKATIQIQPPSCSCIFAATQPEGEISCDTIVWANMTQLHCSRWATVQPSSGPWRSAAWPLWADNHRAGEPAENISKSTAETLQACSSLLAARSRCCTQGWSQSGIRPKWRWGVYCDCCHML